MSAPDRLTKLFESTFRCVQQERMAGLALLNPKLHVRLRGWREWRRRQVGVLLTPWSMSLVCVPGLGGGAGVEHRVNFPSGDYVFVEAAEAGIGDFALCSLFSPVFEFTDQAVAEATAVAALDALFDPRLAAVAISEPVVVDEVSSQRELSRRDLLRAAFLRSVE